MNIPIKKALIEYFIYSCFIYLKIIKEGKKYQYRFIYINTSVNRASLQIYDINEKIINIENILRGFGREVLNLFLSLSHSIIIVNDTTLNPSNDMGNSRA
jgi:hypothetical protein